MTSSAEAVFSGRAEQGAHIIIRRMVLNILRRIDLNQPALVHHADAAGEFGGFAHVVGNENDGGAEFFMNQGYGFLKGSAGERVEGGKGFVHQQDVGFGGDGAQDADALLFAAGEFVRIAV